MKEPSRNLSVSMEADPHDQRLARLFADLKGADGEDAPVFEALIHQPAKTAVHRPVHATPKGWAIAAWSLAAAAAVIFTLKPAFVGTPLSPEEQPTATDRTFPTDCLLGDSEFGSLETTWQSPTDSLFDFAPTNSNT